MLTNKPGNIRKFWKVLLYSILTLGIYLFYWLYINLSEMEGAFEFEKNENQVALAKRFYGVCFFIVLVYAISIINIVVDNPKNIKTVIVYSYYYNVFFTSAGLVFFLYFLRSIFLCQSKIKLSPFNKKAVYSLYVIRFVLDLFVAVMFFTLNLDTFIDSIIQNCGNISAEYLLNSSNVKIFGLLSMISNASNIVLIIFVYRLQLEINALWSCYKNESCINEL